MKPEFSRELHYGYRDPTDTGYFAPQSFSESIKKYNHDWGNYMIRLNQLLTESDYIKISAIQFAYDHKILEF